MGMNSVMQLVTMIALVDLVLLSVLICVIQCMLERTKKIHRIVRFLKNEFNVAHAMETMTEEELGYIDMMMYELNNGYIELEGSQCSRHRKLLQKILASYSETAPVSPLSWIDVPEELERESDNEEREEG